MVGMVNREGVSLRVQLAKAAPLVTARPVSHELAETKAAPAEAPAPQSAPLVPPTAPESKAWAALRTQSETALRALARLSDSLKEGSNVTGFAPATDSPTPAATASAAAGSGQSVSDFPWPGWPRAPLPRHEQGPMPWRPFGVPVVPIELAPQPAA